MAAAAAQAARPAETCPFATSVPISPTSRSDPLSTWIDSPPRPPASPFLPSPWESSRPNSVNAECWDCLEPLGPKHKDFQPLHPSHGLAFSKEKSQNGVLKVSSLSSSGSGGSSAGSGDCSDENRNLVVSANGFSYSSRHMNSEKQMMNNSAESRAGVGESKGFSHRIANSHQQLRQQVNNEKTPESWNSANGRVEGKGNKETFTEQQKRGFLGWVGDDNDSIKEEEVKGGKIKANEGRKAEAADDGVHQSADSVIGLKLGKRTYFEDATGSGSAKPPNGQQNSAVTTKKLKGSSQANQVPRCQVEGCKADLSSAKEYHRRHKVCEMHSKTPKNVVAGQEQRFCQQCSRFHGLSEFDEGKRSCRRRLAGHNERRRKPPPDVLTAVSAANFSLFQENKWPGFLSHQQALPTSSYLENSVISDYMNESWARYRKLDDHIGMNCQTQFPGASRNVSTDGLLMLLQNSKRQMMPMTSNTSRSHPFMKSPMGQGLTLSSPSVVIDNPASSHCLSAMSDSGHALSLLSAESCPNSVSMDLSAHSNTTLGHLIAENHPSPLHHQLMEDNLQERQLLKTKKFLSAQAHSDDNIVNIANTMADGPNCSQHQGSSIASIGIADYLENNSMLSMFQDRSIQGTNTHARPMIDLMQIPHRQTLHSSQQNVTHNPEFSDFHSIFQSQQMI